MCVCVCVCVCVVCVQGLYLATKLELLLQRRHNMSVSCKV